MKHFTSLFACFTFRKLFFCCTWLMLLVMLMQHSLSAQTATEPPNNYDRGYCEECSWESYWEMITDTDSVEVFPCEEPPIEENPIVDLCENLNVLIIIDKSGSIVGYEQDVEKGVMTFVNGLVCPEVRTAVMDFSNEAEWIQREYSDTSTTRSTMKNYFSSFSPYGSTNWNHAFALANTLSPAPDLVLFFTDGNPTSWGWGGRGNYYPYDACTDASTTQPPELYNAMIEANILKGKGAHIFGMGVGEVDEDQLIKVTGSLEYDPSNSSHTIANRDWYYSEDFSALEEDFKDLVGRMCPDVDCAMNLPACPDESNGSIKVSVTVSGSYSYTVTGPVTKSGSAIGDPNNEFVINGLPAGNYVVSVTIPNGNCPVTATCETTITSLGCSIDGQTGVTCFGGSDGSVTVKGSGGTGNYEYSIDGDNWQNDGNFQGLAAGSYEVRVREKDGNKCVSICEVTITEPPALTCDIQPSDTLTCAVTEVTLTLTTNASSASYSWTGPGITGSNKNLKSPKVTEPGEYTVIITDGSGCTKSCSVTVYQDIAEPDCGIAEAEVWTCDTTEMTLSGSSDTDGATFSWRAEEGGSFDGRTDISNPTITAPGKYIMTVTGPNGCTKECEITIETDTISPDCSIQPPAFLDCENPTTTLVGSSTTPGVTYSWTTTDGTITSDPEESEIEVSATGTYTLTVTNPDNGCSSTCTVIVDGDLNLPSCNITGGTLSCKNSSITLILETDATSPIFSWIGPGSFTSDIQNPVVTQPGNYVVEVTDGVTGCTSSCSVLVTQDIRIPSCSATGGVLTCNDETLTLSVTTDASNPIYSWTGPSIVSGADTQNPVVDAPGTYEVTITDGTTGCAKTCTAMVTEDKSVPHCDAGPDMILTCEITQVTLQGSSSTPDATFSWSTIDGNIVSGGNSATPIVNAPGTYVLTVTTPNGCSSVCKVEVTGNTGKPDCNAGPNKELTCDVTQVTLQGSSSTPDVTFSWSTTDGNIVSGGNSATPIVNAAGTYTLTVTAPNGCYSECTVEVTSDTEPPVVECPEDFTIASCTSQENINSAFESWLLEFEAMCDCDIVSQTDLSELTAPDSCGGEVTVVFYAVDACQNKVECSATFTVNPPEEVVVNLSDDLYIESCMSQTEVNGAFTSWINGFSVSGGCNPQISGLEGFTAPDVCIGDTVVITFTVTDQCIDVKQYTARFGVAAPPELTVSCPDDVYIGSCTSQEEINTAFTAWIEGFGFDGGCGATATDLSGLAAPNWCEGDTITVTYRATDACGQEVSCTSTFGVERTPELTVSCSDDVYISSCTSQDEINSAFAAWIAGFGYEGGCGATATDLNSLTAPDWCTGDTITVTYIATDACGQRDTCVSVFGVERTPELTVSCSDDVYIGSCTSQEEIDAAFAAWIEGFGFDGGCGATATDLNSLAAPNWCEGDTIVVTYRATDDCGQEVSCISTFGVERTPELTVSCSDDVYISSCTSQEEINSAFAAWIAGFGYEGGCGATATDLSSLTAPDWCVGDTITVTYIATDACGQRDTCVSVFGVERTPELTVSCSDDVYISSCTSQDEINSAFAAWIAGFGYEGGCGATATDLSSLTAPDWCVGDTITVTYIATDACGQRDTCVSVFGVERTPELTVSCSDDVYIGSCTSQEEIDAAFAAWIEGFGFDGGCGATATDLSSLAAPNWCEGDTIVVTYRATDDCGQEVSCISTFGVERTPEVVVWCPDPVRYGSCPSGNGEIGEPVFALMAMEQSYPGFASQQEIDAAFAEWLEGFGHNSGGCDPIESGLEDLIAPDLCMGDTVYVTYTVTDDCGQEVSCTSSFGVERRQELVIYCPEDITLDACARQADIDAAFDEWIAQFTFSGGCHAEASDLSEYTAPEQCSGESVTVFYSVWDECGQEVSCSATFTTIKDEEPPVIVLEAFRQVPCCTGLSQQFEVPEIFDNCDEDLEISYVTELYYAGAYECKHRRTWTATDACGNTTTATQIVEIIDHTTPVLIPVHPRLAGMESGDTLYLDCDESISLKKDAFALEDDCAPCPQRIEIEMDRYVTDGECGNGNNILQTQVVEWRATDKYGETSRFKIYVVKVDRQGPEFISVPRDKTISCDDEWTFGNPVVEDACSGLSDLTYRDSTLQDEKGRQIHTRTWMAVDGCGNWSSATQTITVDGSAPVFTFVPEDKTVEAGAEIEFDVPVANSDCGEVTVQQIGDDEITGDQCNGKSYTRTWTVSVDAGSTDTITQTIYEKPDDVPPVLSGVPADIVLPCGAELPVASVVAMDNVDGQVTVSESISTEGEGCSQMITRTWTATDACGNNVSAKQYIRFTEEAGITFTYIPSNVSLKLGDELPDDLAIAESECTEGEVDVEVEDVVIEDEICSQVILRHFIAKDGCGLQDTAFQYIVLTDDVVPEVVVSPKNKIVNHTDSVEFDEPEFSDFVGIDTVWMIDTMVMDDCKGGFYQRTWKAMDLCGNISSVRQRITVLPDKKAPVFASEDSVLILGWNDPDPEFEPEVKDHSSEVTVTKKEHVTEGDCMERKEWTWTATDACGNSSTLTWEIIRRGDSIEFDHIPSDYTVECPEDAVFDTISLKSHNSHEAEITYSDLRGEGDCFTGYEITRIWTATDSCGNENEVEQRIFIMGDTTAPVISDIPRDTVLECGEEIPVQTVEASDNCGIDTLIVEMDRRPIKADSCADSVGHYLVRKWIAVDQCGNKDTAVQYIAVLGAGQNSLLTFIDVPVTKVVYCEDEVEFDEPFAKSTCGEVEYSSKDHVIGEPCSPEYKMVREWTATDTCGNSISTYQTVIIRQDTIAPELILDEPVKYIGCITDTMMDFDSPQVWDHCAAELMSIVDTAIYEVEELDSILIRTWTYQDACGNTSSISQELRYGAFDGEHIFAKNSDTIYLDCFRGIDAYIPLVLTCDTLEISYADSIQDSTCINQLTLVRTWKAEDSSGIKDEFVQTFVIQDSIPPVIEIGSDTLYMTEMEYEMEGAIANIVSITDDCGEVDSDIVVTKTEQNDTEIIEYQVIAEDECGNTSMEEFIVVISASPVVDVDYVSSKMVAHVRHGMAPYKYVWTYQVQGENEWIQSEEDTKELDVSEMGPVLKVRVEVIDARNQRSEKIVELPELRFDRKFIVRMHPNPAASYLEVSTTVDEIVRVEMYDVLGQQVKIFTFDEMHDDTSRVHLDIKDLPLGSYVVRIFNGQEVITRQLIKAH